MGEVYRADDTRLKRTVALKRLSPGLRSDPLYRHRFQEEAERVCRFTDFHIAAVYDVIEEQDEILLVMEFVEGQTLRQRLREPMALDQFLRIAVQCAEALIAAHERGIVHCDIKPENIMLTTTGRVKILDFGVAKQFPRSDQSSTIDRSGTVGGTPAYMSPEVLLEKIPDGRADVFSLGIVLYEALAGHHPFLADSYVATTHRVLHDKPVAIKVFNPKVPEELENIVSRMLAKDPNDRYANASHLLDDLLTIQQGVTPSNLLPRPLVVRQVPSKRWVWAVVAPLIIAVAAVGTYWWTHRAPVFHERGWVLISDFDSSGEDPINEKGVREGLSIALQQSPYVNVYPRTRVYEALRRMKRSEVTRIDEALGREISRRENVQVLLTGSIERIGQAYQITVRAVDPGSGNFVLAEKQQFSREGEFFDRADRLARAVRKDLGESLARIDKTSRPLAKVTTPSFYALQLYSEASDFIAQGKIDAVPALLLGSLQLDPDFAMAHRLLGSVYDIQGNRTKELQHLQRAYDLRSGLTDREQRLIESNYYSAKGEYEKSVDSLVALAGLYPDDVEAHDELAQAYYSVGDVEKAIQQIREVLRLNSNSAPAFAFLVRFLARTNANSEAEQTYGEAVRRGLDSPSLDWGLGLALLGDGKVEDARREFSRLESAGGAYQDIGRIYLARTSVYEGKLNLAAQELETEIRSNEAEGNKSPELLSRYLLASIFFEQGKFDLVRQQLRRILVSGEPGALEAVDLRRAGTLYARIGDLGAAKRVLRRMNALRTEVPTSFDKSCSYNLAGEIALSEGHSELAVEMFTAALYEYPLSISHHGMARAYVASHDWGRAAAEWDQVLIRKGEILQDFFPADWVLANLAIGEANQRLNRLDLARKGYAEFLKIWQQGDELKIRNQALKELRELGD